MRQLADIIGVSVSNENKATYDQDPLAKLIEEGEKEFAEGKGMTLTLDGLRDMTHQVA